MVYRHCGTYYNSNAANDFDWFVESRLRPFYRFWYCFQCRVSNAIALEPWHDWLMDVAICRSSGIVSHGSCEYIEDGVKLVIVSVKILKIIHPPLGGFCENLIIVSKFPTKHTGLFTVWLILDVSAYRKWIHHDQLKDWWLKLISGKRLLQTIKYWYFLYDSFCFELTKLENWMCFY